MKKNVLPLVLVLLGSSAGLLYRPVRMLGLFCAGIGILIILFRFLSEREKRSRAARYAKRILLIVLTVGILIFTVLEGFILANNRTDEQSTPSAVLILGAGVYGTTPSVALRARLDAALDYLADKPEIPIVVSGGQGNAEDITEAECMYRYLSERGIDASRILREEEATNTKENIEKSLAVLFVKGYDITDNIAVVTADYHLARAKVLFSAPNFIPVAAHTPLRYLPMTINYYVREAFGLARALILHR